MIPASPIRSLKETLDRNVYYKTRLFVQNCMRITLTERGCILAKKTEVNFAHKPRLQRCKAEILDFVAFLHIYAVFITESIYLEFWLTFEQSIIIFDFRTVDKWMLLESMMRQKAVGCYLCPFCSHAFSGLLSLCSLRGSPIYSSGNVVIQVEVICLVSVLFPSKPTLWLPSVEQCPR